MAFVLFKEMKTNSDVYVRSELVGIVRPMVKMGPGARVSPMTGQREQEVEGEYAELGLARGSVVLVDCSAAEALELLGTADEADRQPRKHHVVGDGHEPAAHEGEKHAKREASSGKRP